MKKTNKKRTGFTIVELVIVIGVIGILAAILIPTFVNLTNKAKDASTKSFVSEINKQLAINDAMDDDNVEKHHYHNLHEVKKFLADEKGFDISKITPSDGSELIWDEDNNKFALVSTSGEVTFADFDITPLAHKKWIVAKSGSTFLPSARIRRGLSTKDADPFDGYSIYLADNSYSGDITVSAGFDAGDNKNIGSITYNSQDEKDVIIRTSTAYTDVVVNSPKSSINYFGSVGSINYQDAENIYLNRNVNIPFLEVTKGRIVIEKGAHVEHIHINRKDPNSFNSITLAIESGVEQLPHITRDKIDIDQNEGTLVVAVQDGNTSKNAPTKYIWLCQQGTMEHIVVTDTDTFDNLKLADEFEGTNVYGVAKWISNNPNGSERGLSPDDKEGLKNELIQEAKENEGIHNPEIETDCEHEYELIQTIEPAGCENPGSGIYRCKLCHNQIQKEIEPLGHDLIGTYCNREQHPAAFVDRINDYTSKDPTCRKLNTVASLENPYDVISAAMGNAEDYINISLDCGFSFKTFKDMSNQQFDNSKHYLFDTNSKTFSLIPDNYPDNKGDIILTALDIYEYFADWYADFYVKFDTDLKPYQFGLGGLYFGYSVAFVVPDNINGNSFEELPAETEIPLIGMMGMNFKYEEVVNNVREFKCGCFNLSKELVGHTFTVSLKMRNTTQNSNHPLSPYFSDIDYFDIAVIDYTIEKPNIENVKKCIESDLFPEEKKGELKTIILQEYENSEKLEKAELALFMLKNSEKFNLNGDQINELTGVVFGSLTSVNEDALSIEEKAYLAKSLLENAESLNLSEDNKENLFDLIRLAVYDEDSEIKTSSRAKIELAQFLIKAANYYPFENDDIQGFISELKDVVFDTLKATNFAKDDAAFVVNDLLKNMDSIFETEERTLFARTVLANDNYLYALSDSTIDSVVELLFNNTYDIDELLAFMKASLSNEKLAYIISCLATDGNALYAFVSHLRDEYKPDIFGLVIVNAQSLNLSRDKLNYWVNSLLVFIENYKSSMPELTGLVDYMFNELSGKEIAYIVARLNDSNLQGLVNNLSDEQEVLVNLICAELFNLSEEQVNQYVALLFGALNNLEDEEKTAAIVGLLDKMEDSQIVYVISRLDSNYVNVLLSLLPSDYQAALE